MYKNYFLVAVRNFWRNKIFTTINVFGLALGISAALVIYLIVYFDFSFDKFHKDGNRIYRVVSDMNFSSEAYYNSGVPYPLPAATRNEVTGIEDVTAFYLYYQPKVTIENAANAKPTVFKDQPATIFADDHYFTFLSYQWLAGSPQTALRQPFQVVLSETVAQTYFPHLTREQMIGKQVVYNDSIKTFISGIVKDLDATTDFTFKQFISLSTVPASGLKDNMGAEQWGSTNSASQCFIKLSAGAQISRIEKQLEVLKNKYRKDDNDAGNVKYHLQPLSDIHFNAHYDTFNQRQAHIPTLYGLLVIALFLLLLGCINFINLTTAQASQRAKEIGIRKTLGSSKKQLIIQFLSETFLLTLTAAVLSALLTPFILKVFSDFIPPELHFDFFHQPNLIFFLFLLVITVSLLSGFYPAIILSGYQPVSVLKNKAFTNSGKTRKAWMRKTLTISQFVIAQVFIMATLIVSKQIHYSLNKDLGFKKHAILYFNVPYNFFRLDIPEKKRFVLLDKLKTIPEIKAISLGSAPPASYNTMSGTIVYKDGKKEISTNVYFKYADPNYIPLYKMKLLAGKNLQASDTTKEFIINETYAYILGFKNPQDAIGKTLFWDPRNVPIVGVVKDFNQTSLHELIKPIALTAAANNGYTFHIAVQPQNADGTAWKTTISKIQKAYKELYPEEDFEYKFVDETIAAFYKSEQNISQLLKWATGLCILISCLGLLGLVMYTTNLRTKEVGIRKVFGASVSQIITLISKDFIKLVLIAFLIATPLAWWAMYKWLENFAYRTSISLWIFAASGFSVIIISLITLSVQTIKAARANPVKSLRTE
jgi:putative ABC transport system permease protein